MARRTLTNVGKLIRAVKNQLPPEQMFLEDLKRSIEMDADKSFRKPSKYYKPSSMNCIRNMYYQRIGADVEAGGSSYVGVGIVNSGSDIHVRIQTAIEAMKDNGIDCEYVDVKDFIKEKKLKNLKVVSQQGMETKLRHKNLAMSFLTDGIILYKGEYYIIEVKTEVSSKFWRRDGVDPYHYMQATAYSEAFGIDDVIFVYISRDTLDMKSYMLHVTDDMKYDLIGRIEECEEYVNRNLLPLKPKDIDKRTCQYCNYATMCRRDT